MRFIFFLLFVSHVAIGHSQVSPNDELILFLSFFEPGSQQAHFETIDKLDEIWKDEFIAPILEVFYFVQDEEVNLKLRDLLQRNIGHRYGFDLDKWYQYLWEKDELIPARYSDFKGEMYGLIDPKFEQYFLDRQSERSIRLDEVRWGGVHQDGIPPLRSPTMINAQEANYLNKKDIVFGIEVKGQFRAYPKRILAWHEMFTDEIDGTSLAGVYCTLCGTMILYNTTFEGTKYELGTSGFLYRSNKLMYDKETQSLWNTLWGEPVIGPLTGKGIKLEIQSVVTTTWGEWKSRHPTTTVLSLNTGHRRDYDEGVAYADYFSTDELMFEVPFKDKRLKNKDEVFLIRGDFPTPIAYSVDFLEKNPIYHTEIENRNFVILTDRSGANRAYEIDDVLLMEFSGNEAIIDQEGRSWSIQEDALVFQTIRMPRASSHRAFWFGWRSAFPNTLLIK